ncbi:MAG: nucleotidyltransferase family protein [Planctomycetaceae bacterium]
MVSMRYTGDALWDRIERAVQKVKDRLNRVSQALDAAGIPYAVIGGNAVQIWVAQVDEAAVRNTRDVDIILKRETLPEAIRALEQAGFTYRHVAGTSMFLDGPDAKAIDAVHVVFAGEKVRPEYTELVPDVDNAETIKGIRTLSLPKLVTMKLTSYRLKDRVHLMDMLGVGLIDPSWVERVPPALQPRLQELIDNPEG